MSSIILMGIKHCGKSTQANLIASYLGSDYHVYDTDDLITELMGKTPRQIYSEQGKDAFLQAELKACEYLKNLPESKNAVVATGGGICNNVSAVQILRSIGTLVFLDADEKIAADRIVREVHTDSHGNLKNLPAYIAKENPCSEEEVREIFHNFYIERKKIYSELCDITVQMKAVSKQENTKSILATLGKL